MTAPETALPPVNERVAALVNDVIRTSGSPEHEHLAERLRAEAARWRLEEVVVVVAAEPNRGKSTLVNAILGEEILPSGATKATSAHIVVRHGPERRASLVRDGQPPAPIAWDEVAGLAVTGVAEGVEGIILEVDHPVLAAGLVLVDTPGVGGLSAAHGRITMAALAKADALVFLLDPAEPLSHPELLFLSKAADRLGRVVFAMVRTDRNPGWRTIADDDRALIGRHAPRFASAPIHPTSARLALAAKGPDGDVDEELLDESGVRALTDSIRHGVVGRVAAVRLANLLQLARTVVHTLEVPAREVTEAAEGTSEAQEVAARAQAEHDELRDAAERLQVDVTDRFNAVRELANLEFGRMMRDLSTHFEAQKRNLAETSEDVLGGLQAEVRAGCAELTERLDTEIATIVDDVVSTIGPIDVDPASLQLGADIVAPAAPAEAGDVDPMGRFRVVSSVASGSTGIAMSANYLSHSPVLAALLGTGAVIAITMGAVNAKVSRRQRDVAALRKQVQSALEGARTEVSTALRQQLLSTQRELERAMKASVRQQARDLQARVTEATQLARSDAAERQAARTEASRRLAALAPLRQRAEELEAEVASLLSS